MNERFPAYYESFRCIADRCEDTCCAGWEIDIDDESYERYLEVGGELGRRLLECIAENKDTDNDMYEQHGFVLTESLRCPFLDKNNLCELYTALGEDSLCEVCKNTPRNFLEYGGVREISISASCPEAARLIYGSKERISFLERNTDEEFPFDEDEDELRLARFIRAARDEAIDILQNRKLDIKSRIEIFLSHAELVQEQLNTGNNINRIKNIEIKYNFDIKTIPTEELYSAFLLRFRTYSGLASIGDKWKAMMELIYNSFVNKSSGEAVYADSINKLIEYIEDEDRLYEYEQLLVYYAYLLLARCIDDTDYLTKAKLVVLSLLMSIDMDAAVYYDKGELSKSDREKNARIYAREVEHAEENLADLYEEILFEKALLDIFVKKM